MEMILAICCCNLCLYSNNLYVHVLSIIDVSNIFLNVFVTHILPIVHTYTSKTYGTPINFLQDGSLIS